MRSAHLGPSQPRPSRCQGSDGTYEHDQCDDRTECHSNAKRIDGNPTTKIVDECSQIWGLQGNLSDIGRSLQERAGLRPAPEVEISNSDFLDLHDVPVPILYSPDRVYGVGLPALLADVHHDVSGEPEECHPRLPVIHRLESIRGAVPPLKVGHAPTHLGLPGRVSRKPDAEDAEDIAQKCRTVKPRIAPAPAVRCVQEPKGLYQNVPL